MIKVRFVCGHELDATGDEEQIRCGCGETQIESVNARAPRFRGHVLGPVAQFENLPAKPVTLGSS